MRMLILILAMLTFAPPAVARETSRHHKKHLRVVVAEPGYAGAVDPGVVQPPFVGGPGPFGPGIPSFAAAPARPGSDGVLDSMIARHAAANGLPVELVRRVVARESGGNPRALSRGNFGLMQIRQGTARAMGYGGPASGLLDPETNLTYAVRYLAGAYRAAGGNHDRAVSYYARGYYAQAKQQGSSPYAAYAGPAAGGLLGWSYEPDPRMRPDIPG